MFIKDVQAFLFPCLKLAKERQLFHITGILKLLDYANHVQRDYVSPSHWEQCSQECPLKHHRFTHIVLYFICQVADDFTDHIMVIHYRRRNTSAFSTFSFPLHLTSGTPTQKVNFFLKSYLGSSWESSVTSIPQHSRRFPN